MKRLMKLLEERKSSLAMKHDDDSISLSLDNEMSRLDDKLEEIEYLRANELSLGRAVRATKSGLYQLKRKSVNLGKNVMNSVIPDIIRKAPISVDEVLQVENTEVGTIQQMRYVQGHTLSSAGKGSEDHFNKEYQYCSSPMRKSLREQKTNWLQEFQLRENEGYLIHLTEKKAKEKLLRDEKILSEHRAAHQNEINRLKESKVFWTSKAQQRFSELRLIEAANASSRDPAKCMLCSNDERQIYEDSSGIFLQRQDTTPEYKSLEREECKSEFQIINDKYLSKTFELNTVQSAIKLLSRKISLLEHDIAADELKIRTLQISQQEPYRRNATQVEREDMHKMKSLLTRKNDELYNMRKRLNELMSNYRLCQKGMMKLAKELTISKEKKQRLDKRASYSINDPPMVIGRSLDLVMDPFIAKPSETYRIIKHFSNVAILQDHVRGKLIHDESNDLYKNLDYSKTRMKRQLKISQIIS